MEKYAVIKLGSKQYLVHEGDEIELERQKSPLKIDVLLYADESDVLIGNPYLSAVSVKTSVLEEKLGKKVRVARFKKKSRYDKVKGHRQPISVVKIDKISNSEKKEEDKEKTIKKDVKTSAKKVEKSNEKKKTTVSSTKVSSKVPSGNSRGEKKPARKKSTGKNLKKEK
ncbi:MAG TPA: 50S ribosomal protein L21 [bacterium]|nr:50S ribosomal protein L21 [bacterium]HQK41631.1 50S ribosomal protein L21 [bacterium]